MAYYDLYHNAPGWGSSGFQFVSPPVPTYQPQPTWGGLDYYRAHGGMSDPSIYDYAWNKVSNYPGAGVGMDEARYWHRHAYGGLTDMRRMLPNDVGAAAAYEVWRNWKYHYGVYGQPLGGDRERQREALVGLAAGEATRLWQYTGRPSDTYGRLQAVEAAAGTATRILSQSWALNGGFDDGLDPYGANGIGGFATPGRISRRGSTASLRSLGMARSLSRPASPLDGYGGGYDTGSMYGGAGSVYGGGGSVYGGSGSVYGDDYDGVYDGYNSNALARRRSFSTLGSAYAPSAPLPMTPNASYASPTYAQPSSYGSYGYASGYSTPAYSPVTILQTPSRRRSHSRHRRHRHGSSSGYYVSNSVPYGY